MTIGFFHANKTYKAINKMTGNVENVEIEKVTKCFVTVEGEGMVKIRQEGAISMAYTQHYILSSNYF